MSRTKALVLVAVVFVAALGGCAGWGGDAGAGDGGDGGDSRSAADGGDGGADGIEAEAQRTRVQETSIGRQVIRTGELELEVESYVEAEGRIRSIAAERGGYVSDSAQRARERGGERWTTGTVVLRVPVEAFDDAFEALKGEGELERAETKSEDATDRLVDIEARLENRRAERDRLRALYEGANETADVLAVGRELSETQGEIERLEAEQRALEDRVAYATITVRLAEPAAERERATVGPAWYETPVAQAFVDSVGGVATAFRAIVVAIAYLAPYAIALGGPAIAVAAAYRRFG